jgi:site-specific DNA-methyltransferase (cytosine-N4-specific)
MDRYPNFKSCPACRHACYVWARECEACGWDFVETNLNFVNKLFHENCHETMSRMPDGCVDLVITSPPYFGCRHYGGETLGREQHPAEYVSHVVAVGEMVRRVLSPSGSFYLNLGDVYFGTKGFSRNSGRRRRKTDHHYQQHKVVKPTGGWLQHKQLLMLPSRIAAAMQDSGWMLRNHIIWVKANPLPAFASDRRLPCYEDVFHFVTRPNYYFDYETAKRIGSHRDFFRTNVRKFGEHPASFSEDVVRQFVLTSSRPGDLVYDPFLGSGTTAVVASRLGRCFVGSETNERYCELARQNVSAQFRDAGLVLPPPRPRPGHEQDPNEHTT